MCLILSSRLQQTHTCTYLIPYTWLRAYVKCKCVNVMMVNLQLYLQEEEELRLWRCSLHGQSELTKLFLLYPFFFFDPFFLFSSPFSVFQNKKLYSFSFIFTFYSLLYTCFSLLVPLTIYYFCLKTENDF